MAVLYLTDSYKQPSAEIQCVYYWISRDDYISVALYLKYIGICLDNLTNVHNLLVH